MLHFKVVSEVAKWTVCHMLSDNDEMKSVDTDEGESASSRNGAPISYGRH